MQKFVFDTRFPKLKVTGGNVNIWEKKGPLTFRKFKHEKSCNIDSDGNGVEFEKNGGGGGLSVVFSFGKQVGKEGESDKKMGGVDNLGIFRDQ